jgi:hypothetical protein
VFLCDLTNIFLNRIILPQDNAPVIIGAITAQAGERTLQKLRGGSLPTGIGGNGGKIWTIAIQKIGTIRSNIPHKSHTRITILVNLLPFQNIKAAEMLLTMKMDAPTIINTVHIVPVIRINGSEINPFATPKSHIPILSYQPHIQKIKSGYSLSPK